MITQQKPANQPSLLRKPFPNLIKPPGLDMPPGGGKQPERILGFATLPLWLSAPIHSFKSASLTGLPVKWTWNLLPSEATVSGGRMEEGALGCRDPPSPRAAGKPW